MGIQTWITLRINIEDSQYIDLSLEAQFLINKNCPFYSSITQLI